MRSPDWSPAADKSGWCSRARRLKAAVTSFCVSGPVSSSACLARAIACADGKVTCKVAKLAGGNGPTQGVWSPFNKDTGYFKPSAREFMINFAVDDLDGFLVALEAKGVEVKGRQEMDGMGKFAWILDPDGTKIEFWEPAK